MTWSNLARVLFVGAAVVLAAASASSSNQNNQNPSMMPQNGQPQGGGAPSPQQMEPGRVLGLWRSTFGAVKIEADNTKGGLQSGSVQGVWVYQRQGQEVIGYFAGNLRGNVMQFRWQEPGSQGGPPLNGEGWLQFDTAGRQYSGRWWTDRRDRVGDWNGRRSGATEGGGEYGQDGGAYGGNAYGGAGPYGGSTYGDPYREPEQQPYGSDPNRGPYAPPAPPARQPQPRRPAPPPNPTYY